MAAFDENMSFEEGWRPRGLRMFGANVDVAGLVDVALAEYMLLFSSFFRLVL